MIKKKTYHSIARDITSSDMCKELRVEYDKDWDFVKLTTLEWDGEENEEVYYPRDIEDIISLLIIGLDEAKKHEQEKA